MITLFTTPKDFDGHFDIIQTNAFNSWRALSKNIEIIIFGESKGAKEVSNSINAKYISDNKINEFGTPYLDDMFKLAQNKSKFNILCYINSDIILPKNFLEEVKICAERFSKFLMIGHRWDFDCSQKINFKNDIELTNFWSNAKSRALQHGPTGIDYHVFTKNLWGQIPNFLVGRTGYDNWLIWKARRKLVPIIDATNKVFMIHQNHDYSSIKTASNKPNKIDGTYTGPEGKHNEKYLGNNSSKVMNILDCTHKINGDSINRKIKREEKIRNLFRLPKVFPELSIPIKLYRRLYLKIFS